MSDQQELNPRKRETELNRILSELYAEPAEIEHAGDAFVRVRLTERGAFLASYSSVSALVSDAIGRLTMRLGYPSSVTTDDERRNLITKLKNWALHAAR